MTSVQHVEVDLSHKCFEAAVEEVMEDAEIMNCLTKLHECIEQSGSD